MKSEILICAVVSALLVSGGSAGLKINCNTRLLQYYGLEGLSHAVPYTVMEQINSDNFCPNLQQTCCTSEDFNLTREMWAENSLKIKGYLTQIFRVLQKVSTIQSSLIQFMPRIQNKNTAACKKIDSTFFNSPIKFDEMHFYVRNALEAFAYIQKGFYCMICDPTQHAFFQRKTNYGRIFVQMSQKSCDDLVFFFREFLAYKVYFFNPLVKNLNQVLNCIHDNDEKYFDVEHQVSYQGINDCLTNKNYCWKVCKEFRFGISSNLFIGQLSEYKKLMKTMESTIAEMSHTTAKFEELDFLDEDYSGEFFARHNDTIVLNNMNILKDQNISRAELLFTDEGLDLFYIAVGSNYFLTDATTLETVKRHYEIVKPNEQDQTVLDPTAEKVNDAYTVPPDLSNTRLDPEKEKEKQLEKLAPPEDEIDNEPLADGGLDSEGGASEGAGGSGGDTDLDDMEKKFMNKLSQEHPDDTPPAANNKTKNDGGSAAAVRAFATLILSLLMFRL